MIRRAIQVVRRCARIVVCLNPEIRPGFRPDVIRFGRMLALYIDAVIRRGVGNLHRVRVAGRGQAVEVRRGWITKELLRIGSRVPLHPVVVLQRNQKNGLDLARNKSGLRGCDPKSAS